MIGVTISKEKSSYSEFYVGTIFDISSLFFPVSNGGFSDANSALIGRTYAETRLQSEFQIKRFEDLFKAGANINIQDAKGRTPLIIASQSNTFSKRVKSFIAWGATVNHADFDGKTALIHAVIANAKEIVKELIKSNADKNIKDKSGKTALDYALGLENNKDFLKLLKD